MFNKNKKFNNPIQHFTKKEFHSGILYYKIIITIPASKITTNNIP